jgi:hypothetical protein
MIKKRILFYHDKCTFWRGHGRLEDVAEPDALEGEFRNRHACNIEREKREKRDVMLLASLDLSLAQS